MKHRFVIGLLLILLILPASIVQAKSPQLYPPCGDRQPPDMYEGFCRPVFLGGQYLRLRDGVPFAWIRDVPQGANILVTVYPSSTATMQVLPEHNQTGCFWDGYQWWWRVVTSPDGRTVGWIEQASLRDSTPPVVIDDPSILATWIAPLDGQVELGLPFLWLRDTPASTGRILITIPANASIRILGAPAFDGVQWWWFVEYRNHTGYVEQSLLVAK